MAKEYKDLVVGLDIGTSKVMVVVGEVMPGGELKLAGLGVAASLKAFAAGWQAAQAAGAEPAPAHSAAAAADLPAVGPRLTELAQRVQQALPLSAQAHALHAIVRLTDYQDEGYARLYLERLQTLVDLAPADESGQAVIAETARHLALWMSYEDTVRVADLKTRRSRFERVGQEVRINERQDLHIHEFLHPRLEEIADTLPAGVGRWLLCTGWARSLVGRWTRSGRVVQTSSLRGYLLLYAVASLRGWRPRSLRYQVEQQRIEAWLADVTRLLPAQAALALEVARAQQLVKGYGDTHARGWRHFEMIMGQLDALSPRADGASRLRTLVAAALADDGGQALQQALRQA